MDTLEECLNELNDEIEDEEIEALGESLDEDFTREELRDWVHDNFQTVRQLIRSRMRWLEGERFEGSLHSTYVPGWYLDFQREFVTAQFAREWLGQLDNVVPRLSLLPSLALSVRPPKACRTTLEDATRCFLQGLSRAAATLCRTALEIAVRDRLAAATKVVTISDLTKLSKLLDQCERIGLLRGAALEDARVVWRVGNDAAHGRATREQSVADALVCVRRVLEALYGRQPDPDA